MVFRAGLKTVAFTIAVLLLVGLVACGCSGADGGGRAGTDVTGREGPGRFGVLTGDVSSELASCLREIGIGWIRPHPGPCVWGDMQPSAGAGIDFSGMDTLVGRAGEYGFELLVTVWPYADWDQVRKPDAGACRAAAGDRFSGELPDYRGKPFDLDACTCWLSTVVERYDGDGVSDMPWLERPVRNWEISNEPDLESDELLFFAGGPDEYAELLVRLYAAVKAADSDSRVLIAGAAGSRPEFLDYWRGVFSSEAARESFDIGNVHCISQADWRTLNVEAYSALLEEAGIEKPVWVTEAEAVSGTDPSANEARLQEAVGGAFAAGAEKVFFTGASMSGGEPAHDPRALLQERESYETVLDAFR